VVRHDGTPFRRNGFLVRACRDGAGFPEQRHTIREPTAVRRGEDGVRLGVSNDVVRLCACAAPLMNHDEADAKKNAANRHRSWITAFGLMTMLFLH